MALIGINVLVYLAELAAGGNQNGTGNWIYEHGVLLANVRTYAATCCHRLPRRRRHGEWWRLITAAFLHYGPSTSR